jgi:superfamily II DNA or RNA helicase
MARLEDIQQGAQVKGIVPGAPVTILSVQWHGSDVLEITYLGPTGQPGNELLFRDREPAMEAIAAGAPWAFDANAEHFRLVSEAYRIGMAHLFDPWLAVHLSLVEPLPHQISAVYEDMLPRQPLRYLLADDPGAGKTIMAGLLIKELMLRGDVERCLVICPGNLTEQWQDELFTRFHLPFDILTNDRINAARTGNVFQEMPLLITRLDKMSRDEALQETLRQSDWDLVIVDEAHKMSASMFGNEINYTKRYHLGQLVSERSRHLLLLTATPHNGKQEDFQLFMALIDADRFAGRYRQGVHNTDVSDLMRRVVKEQLLKFDGTPLFPERRAYTVAYRLSELEAALYEAVTEYVRDEFNRADNLDKERRGTVGFALTMLQRRLASSPQAIYQSLHRRRERLERRLREERLLHRGATAQIDLIAGLAALDEEQVDEIEEAPEAEYQHIAEQVVDQASAARTIAELEAEIARLKELEALAERVRRSGQDRKWTELSRLLQDQAEMFDPEGNRRKLIIFTEHRDTLDYLAGRIATLIGRPQSVVIIHGGLDRKTRRATQEAFTQDKDVLILVATDAAGEGINLQRAHLMVNYDLPWNPARIEQRFGRIHRIGQTEVCHLWNLVAEETREGDVYARLLRKIEEQRLALGDRVFDVLGDLFRETSLRQLLIEAVRYGDQPDVRARLFQAVDNLSDRDRVRELLEDRALARDSMDTTRVRRIRADFERAQARRLQPHFIASFFKAAFEHLGGTLHPREPRRYEITHVPAAVRNRCPQIGYRRVLRAYERVTFHKEEISIPGKPVAEFVCPGHPLMDAVLDLVLERHRTLLRQGAVLVDPDDPGDQPRLLFYLEQSIQTPVPPDEREGRAGDAPTRRVLSREMQFVELDEAGEVRSAGPAPFLDYDPLPADLHPLLGPCLAADWLCNELEARARAHAAQHLVPDHLQRVRDRQQEMVDRTLAAVKDRLTKEIAYWDHRAQELRAQEQAGRTNARLNSEMARRRADDLAARLQRRLAALEAARHVAPQPPAVIGGALVVPAGLLARLRGQPLDPEPRLFAHQRRAVEEAAIDAVMARERASDFDPQDVSRANLGWDIESAIPGTGRLRFLEVKGRVAGADTITVTRNEIMAALNKPDDFILAVVEVDFVDNRAVARDVHYLRQPFQREPDFAATSVNYDIAGLLAGAGEPQ